ncbi:(R,R)-butanediol dehydrogenase KNAG_0I00120 [Huiozyma naganishii CBS 8797]|uniref:Enoyl reductase (ER) domain-containing protein n=1 Tax=Huiozyma naganishii (strain ATCC MYA-139 / BCRC 22969 / CBS 8797 / KCTC 17520 / NBRC 10181 / NCYC 3082 / Yp74L-3) TaxID=1071383 RepID=J7S8Y0_HUIN7|nr:hypothetical protein KNAG_0I00120 [Kazachstania naganishii CBS 8797]CCK71804.1 hypothetical protein KNAG_0I00120 [Kazachstania naganishii CBS 8797]
MRGLAYFKKGDIHFTDELREPEIEADDELIVDVAFCGICGTDLHEYTDGPIFMPKDGEKNVLSNKSIPQAMGHEFSGYVAKVGPKVTKVKVGDRVVVEATCSCVDLHRWPESKHYKTPACNACKDRCDNCCEYAGFMGLGVVGGAFAERIVTIEHHVVKLPDGFPMDVAALIEPLSVAWHAARVSKFPPGKSALVLGAGPIGLAMILVLKAQGASKIIVSEPATMRRELADRMHVETFDPSTHGDKSVAMLRSKTFDGKGFDFAFDCSGVPATFNTGLQAAHYRGTLCNVAIWGSGFDFNPMGITLLEKDVTGSIGYTVQDFAEVTEAFKDGKIDIEECKHLITGRYRIEDGWEKGFLELMNNKATNIKVLLSPNNHGELD